MGKCGFLTGWAIPPSFYSLPHDWVIFDSTKEIHSSSSEILAECDTIVGFSLGAIIALNLAQQRSFEKIILIAPTFSFCKTVDNSFGVSPKIIDSMIVSLQNDPIKMASRFYHNCGITSPIQMLYTDEELRFGLEFLQKVTIDKKPLAGNPELFVLHGNNDRIISIDAGREVAAAYGIAVHETSGGHIAPLDDLLMNYFNL